MEPTVTPALFIVLIAAAVFALPVIVVHLARKRRSRLDVERLKDAMAKIPFPMRPVPTDPALARDMRRVPTQLARASSGSAPAVRRDEEHAAAPVADDGGVAAILLMQAAAQPVYSEPTYTPQESCSDYSSTSSSYDSGGGFDGGGGGCD